jgi:hypothetical protein
VSARYEDRAASHAAAGDVERRRSQVMSRLRLATFLPAAGAVAWMAARGFSIPLTALAALLLIVFGVLVVRHARIEERIAWFDALRLVNQRALARVKRDWDGLPAATPPGGVDLTHHPYALDLDLFGRASLAQWIGPSATLSGSASLSAWLLEPADPAEIRARQEAVAELAPALAWREELAAHGVLASGFRVQDLDRFFSWAEGSALFPNRMAMAQTIVWLLTLSIWTLLALHVAGAVDTGFWMIPLIAGLVLSFGTARRVHGAFDRAGAGQQALSRYAGVFEHAVASPAGAARLKDVRQRLGAEGRSSPQCMRRLNRILGFADMRRGAASLHFVIQALTLWDFHVAFALDRWREHAGRHVRGWIAALGELDALASIANAAFDNPSWCVPELGTDALVTAIALGHPLLPDDRRVPNDVEIGPPGSVLLVTGSNMSGKSTLLRAVGLNVVLAQAGAPACARSLRLPPVDLEASIRVQDSLELGLSYFMAALARLKGVVDAAERRRQDRVLVYLLDEILQGTNSAERSIAVRGIVRHLLEAGAIGAMTTHDLAIAAEKPLDKAAHLVHFTETVDREGRMSFDYRLLPGLATSRNALRLMQLVGIELLTDERPV